MINDGKPEEYGVIWMITTYVIILGLLLVLTLTFGNLKTMDMTTLL